MHASRRSVLACVQDIARAMELGREAAEYVSKTFVKPIKLEFEKVTSQPRALLIPPPPPLQERRRLRAVMRPRRDGPPRVPAARGTPL